MKLLKSGKNTSVEVTNITSFGVWLLVDGTEHYLDYHTYPWFQNQTVSAIKNVQLRNKTHLRWPDIDVDLEIDNLENPEKYPLQSKICEQRSVYRVKSKKTKCSR